MVKRNKTPVYPEIFRRVVKLLKYLPGVGESTATRFVYFFLSSPESYVKELSESLLKLSKEVKLCKECNNLSEGELCQICEDSLRDESQLCIVENVESLVAIEKSGAYNGKYYVLHGTISPINGIGPEELRVDGLLKKLRKRNIKEVIIATGSGVEGETTALYIRDRIKEFKLKISRLAHGIPMGTDIQYVDSMTLERALKNRVTM